MVPYFNAGIFLENKQQVGKVDEILGPMKQYVGEDFFSNDLNIFCSLVVFGDIIGEYEIRFI